MNELQMWCGTQTWTASVHEMLTKLWNKTESDVVALFTRITGCRSHQQRSGPSQIPAVPTDVCQPSAYEPAIKIGDGRGLGLAAELSPLGAEHRVLVFEDESGFYMLAGDWSGRHAPEGQTPVIRVETNFVITCRSWAG